MKRFVGRPTLMGLLISALAFVALIACSTASERKIPARASDLEEKGIAIGFMTRQRVGGALGSFDDFAGHKFLIQGAASGKTIEHLGAGYFQVLLPPGDYLLTQITVASGELRPMSQPLQFSLEAGAIKYIGSIVMERDASKDEILSRKKYILAGKKLADKGFRRRRVPSMDRSEPITLYVVNTEATVGAIFKRRNPDLSGIPIVLDPLR